MSCGIPGTGLYSTTDPAGTSIMLITLTPGVLTGAATAWIAGRGLTGTGTSVKLTTLTPGMPAGAATA